MILEKEGNYKLEDWKLTGMECIGREWAQKQRPCHSVYTLEDGDIVKRKSYDEFCYGFICPKCHCFTEVAGKLIPDEIKDFCPQVAAPGSDEYMKNLTDEEKELSKYL